MSKPLSVADYIAKQIEASGKTQKQIAEEVGFSKPNIITMIKQGLTRMPLERAPALAKSLGLDPAHFVRMVLKEYSPETLGAIEQSVGTVLSSNERKLIEAVRSAGGIEDPKAAETFITQVAETLLSMSASPHHAT